MILERCINLVFESLVPRLVRDMKTVGDLKTLIMLQPNDALLKIKIGNDLKDITSVRVSTLPRMSPEDPEDKKIVVLE